MTMALFGITVTVFLLAFAGLAVGVILTEKKELQGSCGGPSVNDECCQTCPDKEACDDLEGEAGHHPLEVPALPDRATAPSLAQHP